MRDAAAPVTTSTTPTRRNNNSDNDSYDNYDIRGLGVDSGGSMKTRSNANWPNGVVSILNRYLRYLYNLSHLNDSQAADRHIVRRHRVDNACQACDLNKAIADVKSSRPLSGVASWRGSLSIRHSVKFVLPPIE